MSTIKTNNITIENDGTSLIIKSGATVLLTITIANQNVAVGGDLLLTTGAIKNNAPGVVITAGSTDFIEMDSVTDDITINGEIAMNNVTVNGNFAMSGATNMFQLDPITSLERDALTPSNGVIIYNETTHKFQGRANGAWVDFH